MSPLLTVFRFLLAPSNFRRDALVSASSILFWDIFQSALNLDFEIGVAFDTPSRGEA
jgi:hypothetical protein